MPDASGTKISSPLFTVIPVCKYMLIVSASALSLREDESKGPCSASELEPTVLPLRHTSARAKAALGSRAC